MRNTSKVVFIILAWILIGPAFFDLASKWRGENSPFVGLIIIPVGTAFILGLMDIFWTQIEKKELFNDFAEYKKKSEKNV